MSKRTKRETKQQPKQESEHDNSGALFKNDRKTKSKHPDYTGSAVVDGVEYWLAGWKRTSKSGKAYLSLALTVKEDAEDSEAEDSEDAEDIPF